MNMWVEALVTFLNPHNRPAVSWTERIPPNFTHCGGHRLQSKKKEKKKENIMCHQTARMVSSKEDAAVQFDSKMTMLT